MVTENDIREAKSAYQREYYKKNRERIRENQRRYWERKAEQMKQAAGKQDEQGCNDV